MKQLKHVCFRETLFKRRCPSAWKLAGLAFGALIVVGGAVGWTFRFDLLTFTVTHILDRNGLGPAQLIFDRIDLYGLHAHDIRLYNGAVQAAELTMAYTPFQLVAAHVNEVDITGLRVIIVSDDSGFMLGGRSINTSTSSNAASPIVGFQVDAVKIADAKLVLDRPGGRFETAFSTNLEFAGIDLRKGNFSVDVTIPIGGARRTLHLIAPQLALLSQENGALLLSFEKTEIMAKDLPWAAEDINGHFFWQTDGLKAKIAVNRLINTQQPALVEPTRLSGNVSMTDKRIDFDLQTETKAANAKGMIRIDAKGHHDRSSDRGSASIAMVPVIFHPQGVQPVDFFPVVSAALSTVTGSMAISGSVHWQGDSLSPDLVVQFADISSEVSGVRLNRIGGDIKLNRLWPLATPPGQVLKAIVEAGGLPPSAVTLEFQLLAKPTLMAERMQIGFANGWISTSPFAIDPAIPKIDTVLQFEQVDLSEVFRLINIDGLGGTGRLDGHMAMHFVQGHVRIDDGRLAASGPGVLQFRSDKLPKEITEAGESVQLVLQAMADFHYESLILELNESVNGEGTIILRLRGNNPAVLDGHPFNFNIKFESNFDNLTDIAMRSMATAQELLLRTERRMRK